MRDPEIFPPNHQRPKKRFSIFLGVSLALNLLFFGAIAGAVFKGGGKRGGPPSMRVVAAPYVDAFDVATKRDLRKEMRAKLPARKEAMAANNADYQTMLELLRAENFDIVGASEVIEAQFARGGQFQRVGRELSIKRLSEMNSDERRAYADRLQERLENRKKSEKRKER